MAQVKSFQQSKFAKFPVIIILRWILGIYLIGGCLSTAYMFVTNWTSILNMVEIDPSIRIYPMLIAWLFKLISGGLFLIRSKWLLASIPAWIAAFAFDFLSRNGVDQLPPEFFLAIGIQFVILSFAFLLNAKGRLK